MKIPKKEIRLCFIDDEEINRRQLVELGEIDFPSAEVTGQESLARAFRGLKTYSLMIIDVSACAGDMLHPEWAYGPIRHFMREYRAPNILVVSGMSLGSVEFFVEDLKKYVDDKEMADRIHVGGWAGDWKKLSEKIKKLHPAEEFEY